MELEYLLLFTTITALIVFCVYRIREHQRIAQMQGWISEYLKKSYSGSPHDVTVHCSEDRSWPALVSFDDQIHGGRWMLQFQCSGNQSNWRKISERRLA